MNEQIVIQYWSDGSLNREEDPTAVKATYLDIHEDVRRYSARLPDGSDLILLVGPQSVTIDGTIW